MHFTARYFLQTILLLLTATSAMAEIKVGVVDMQRIFDSYHKTKGAQDKLMEVSKKYEEEIASRRKELQKMAETLERALEETDSDALSPESRGQRRKAQEEKLVTFQKTENEFRQLREQREMDLNQRNLKMREELVGEIRVVVNEVCKGEAFDLVLDSSSGGVMAPGSVLFTNPAFDFTDKVLTKLNGEAPKAAASAPGEAAAATPRPTPRPASKGRSRK